MKETILKALVYNDSEKTRVKQHKILRGNLSETANLKFAVSFLHARYKTGNHFKLKSEIARLVASCSKN